MITRQATVAWSVYAADLDGDGDQDVLSASRFDDKIAWYENEGGGQFGPQQVIMRAADGPESVHAADLDGDGDPDVLSASRDNGKIVWHENEGGGRFGPQQVITTAANEAASVYAADLDGDGDPDVLSASVNDDKIAWYENSPNQLPMPREASPIDPPGQTACRDLTIPASWTTVPGSATTYRFQGKTYEVQNYLAVDVEGTPMIPVVRGVKQNSTSAVAPAQSLEETLAVTARLLNRDASALSLRVGAQTDWREQAKYWDDQQQQYFDSSKGNVAAGRFIVGKLLVAIAAEMASLGTANALMPSTVALSKAVSGRYPRR